MGVFGAIMNFDKEVVINDHFYFTRKNNIFK